ncbi:hypothetical protein H6G33_02340 [Calothrix sp. FACHB-1219]|uniref:hypothetical protein n=1 Tax=unclassified Calothrix TaxID=2619626 RepID=UPI0016884E1A|nr:MULTISPECIES: hypothetical protein [unclassified Calothrix]MBD2201444.1 hypothetical protein [Calothrix sp. FACHB-168]MBD2215876.1 hypothetical protein [Calothrix sp. FACHB-1219]
MNSQESNPIQNEDQLDYKVLLTNAKQALKVQYQKSAALASQLEAIKNQLEQVQAENKILRESTYEDVIKHFETRTQAAEVRALKTEVRQKFLEANGCQDDDSFDTLWETIKNQIQIQDGDLKIISKNGTPKFTFTGKLLSLKDFIQSLKENPTSRKFFLD